MTSTLLAALRAQNSAGAMAAAKNYSALTEAVFTGELERVQKVYKDEKIKVPIILFDVQFRIFYRARWYQAR